MAIVCGELTSNCGALQSDAYSEIHWGTRHRVRRLLSAAQTLGSFFSLEHPQSQRRYLFIAPITAVHNAEGQAVGFECYVKAYNKYGVELDIDEHRVFINPPAPQSYSDDAIIRCAVDVLHESVVNNPGYGHHGGMK